MNRNCTAAWFPALLTAGSFLATLSLWTLALLDALAGSVSCQLEFGIGFGCALAFVSLLESSESNVEPAAIDSRKE